MNIRKILLALWVLATGGHLFAQSVVVPDLSGYEEEFLPTVYYTEGVRASAEERYEDAMEWFRLALGVAPDHAPSFYEMGNLMSMRGDYERALGYSVRAVELDGGNTWYRSLKARLLVYSGRYDEALPMFEGMLGDGGQFDPDNYRVLAVLYHDEGRVDEAIATLDEAEVKMGKNPAVVDLKRSILIDAGRVDEAVAVTESYVAATPYDEENRLVLADIYGYRGQDSLRAAMLKQVLEVNPDNVGALVSLADHYLEQGSPGLYFATVKQLFLLDEVPLAEKTDHFSRITHNRSFYRRHFNEISDLALTLVTRYPGEQAVMELYSDHMIRSGDVESAVVMLKTLLDRPEPRLETFLQVMEIEAYLQRQDSVAFYSDRALRLFPGEQRVYMMKSGALQYMGRNREARKVLEQALKRVASDSLRSELLGSIGTIWYTEGNMKKAFKYYEQALRHDPDNHHVLNNYAYFLAEDGRHLDRALGMASRAIKLHENSSTYLDTYAWVLYKQGNYGEARRVMQQALPLDSSNSSVLLFHYGDILYALGENFMASVYWKRARDAGYSPAEEVEERLSRLGP